jgi:hypothetical protein
MEKYGADEGCCQVRDYVIQQIAPDDSVVFEWNTKDHLDLVEGVPEGFFDKLAEPVRVRTHQLVVGRPGRRHLDPLEPLDRAGLPHRAARHDVARHGVRRGRHPRAHRGTDVVRTTPS